jgi:hypothetical protein
MSQAIVATQRGLVDAMADRGIGYKDPFNWQSLVDALYPYADIREFSNK